MNTEIHLKTNLSPSDLWPQSFFSALNRFRKESTLCDLTLATMESSGEQCFFRVHSLVLSAASKVIKAKILNSHQKVDILSFPAISAIGLSGLVSYLYGEELVIFDQSHCLSVIQAASLLEVAPALTYFERLSAAQTFPCKTRFAENLDIESNFIRNAAYEKNETTNQLQAQCHKNSFENDYYNEQIFKQDSEYDLSLPNTVSKPPESDLNESPKATPPHFHQSLTTPESTKSFSDDEGNIDPECTTSPQIEEDLGNVCQNKGGEKTSLTKPKKKRKTYVPCGKYICPYCGILYKVRGDYVRHLSREHPPSQDEFVLMCVLCHKHFNTRKKLLDHARTHSEAAGDYLCQLCGKTFTKDKYYQTHLKRHEGSLKSVKKYKCSECGLCFHGPHDVKEHYLCKHTDRKDYQCHLCGKPFSTNRLLASHLKFFHGVNRTRPHQCKVCSKWFDTGVKLRNHSVSHTGEKPHQCQWCQKSFSRKDNLTAHQRKNCAKRLENTAAFS